MRFVVYDQEGNIYTQAANSGKALDDAVRKFNPDAKLNRHNSSGSPGISRRAERCTLSRQRNSKRGVEVNHEEELSQQLRRNAEGILQAYPAAKSALEGAMSRLNAPWYVRAWHQWKGHEGWGCGEELHLFVYIPILILIVGALWAWSLMAHK